MLSIAVVLFSVESNQHLSGVDGGLVKEYSKFCTVSATPLDRHAIIPSGPDLSCQAGMGVGLSE